VALKPEVLARKHTDEALDAAGWCAQDTAATDLGAGRGVAIREYPLKKGHGFADYLLYVERKGVGVIEAKKDGETLTVVRSRRGSTVTAPRTICRPGCGRCRSLLSSSFPD
jgi:type I restriction enzyme, R subunit